MRWAITAVPGDLEAYFGDGAHRVGNNLDWWQADWAAAVYLRSPPRAHDPMGPMATLLLALGLAAKEPGESTLAVDGAAAALSEGRTSGLAIGDVLALLLPTQILQAKRLARTFATVAQTSATCAAEVRVAIQRLFRGDRRQGPGVRSRWSLFCASSLRMWTGSSTTRRRGHTSPRADTRSG